LSHQAAFLRKKHLKWSVFHHNSRFGMPVTAFGITIADLVQGVFDVDQTAPKAALQLPSVWQALVNAD
jgi:hypothetical protein